MSNLSPRGVGEPEPEPEPVNQVHDLTNDHDDPSRGWPWATEITSSAAEARRLRLRQIAQRILRRVATVQVAEEPPADYTADPVGATPGSDSTPRVFRRELPHDSRQDGQQDGQQQDVTDASLSVRMLDGVEVAGRLVSDALNRPLAFAIVTASATGTVVFALSTANPWILCPALIGLIYMGLRFVDGPLGRRRRRGTDDHPR